MDVSTLLARAEITDVLTRYVRGADRADWDLVRSCYHPDATDDHGLYSGGVDGLISFLADLATALTSTSHHLGPPHLDVEADVARAETYCIGWYERPDRDGRTVAVAQGLRYLDRFECRSGRWAIAERTVVLDWERLLPEGQTDPAPSWQRGARAGDDPSSGFFPPRG